jgi:hypothetical protein
MPSWIRHKLFFRSVPWLGAVLFLLITGTVLAQETASVKTLEAIGSSAIYKDHVSRARELAIADGLEKALETVVAEQLPIETMIQYLPTLSEVVFGQNDRFIQDYQVLTEARTGDTYRVIVRARISIDGLQEQLSSAGIMVGRKPIPRVLFFITEQDIGAPPPKLCGGEDAMTGRPVAERKMAEVFKQKGFTLLSLENSSAEVESPVFSCNPDFNNGEVAKLAGKLKADVVVVGKSVAELTTNVMEGDIKSFSGTVTVRAIRTDTGDTIASASEKSVTANTDERAGATAALAEAGTKAAEALSSTIIETWKADKGLAKIKIIVEGTHHLGNFVMFRRTLTQVPGVKELQTREFKADEATLVVSFEGSAKDLADALLVKTFDSFGINITEVLEGLLRIELLPG